MWMNYFYLQLKIEFFWCAMTLQTRCRRKTLSSESVCDSFQSLCAFSYHFDAQVQNFWVSLQWFCTSLLPLCVFLLVSVFWGLFLIFMCLSVSVWTRLISLIDLLLFVLSAGLCCHFASLFLHVCLFMFVMCLFCAFLYFLCSLVNHSSLVVDLPVVSCYWFASFLTIFVSLILLQLLFFVFTLTASLTFLHSWWFGNTRAACAETNTPVTELCLSIPDWKNPAAVTCFPVTTEKFF